MEEQIDYEERASLLKALSNPIRLQIVHGLLISGCHNVGCMEASTGMSQSCISQHLQKLRAANVVTAERSGNEVYYQVASREVASLVADLLGEEADSWACPACPARRCWPPCAATRSRRGWSFWRARC